MSNGIFEQGTVAKQGIYKLICDKLVEAGWSNISSNPSVDGDVFTSKGEDGTKNLVINIRPYGSNIAYGPIDNSAYAALSYRLQTLYTPSVAGSSGAFGRSSLVWSTMPLIPNAESITISNITLTYKMLVNKSKMILVLEYPSATGYNPLVTYIGEPTTLYTPEGDSRGVLFIQTANMPVVNTVNICDCSANMGSETAPYQLMTKTNLATKNPNTASMYIMSDITYGYNYSSRPDEGIRGVLDDIYALPNTNILTGDILVEGSKKYYALVTAVYGNNGFPAPVLAVRIE